MPCFAFRILVAFALIVSVASGMVPSTHAQINSAQTPAATVVEVPAGAVVEVVDAIVEEIASVEESLTTAFNAGNVDRVVDAFLSEGELIDEFGVLYRGHAELRELFSKYFEEFPGAKLSLQIDSIRKIGDHIAVEEGTRFTVAGESAFAQVRYIATLAKQDGKWKLASIREFSDHPAPSSGERLQALAWLVGDWVSESSDLAVRISYRWDEDKNFLIGKFLATQEGKVVLKTEQRIGWDPLAGKVRSWLFDSDGGFGKGVWTPTEEGWLIKSESTDPSGAIGFATVVYRQLDDNRYRMIGTDRLIDDELAEDFDVTVTRAPPKPTQSGQGAEK